MIRAAFEVFRLPPVGKVAQSEDAVPISFLELVLKPKKPLTLFQPRYLAKNMQMWVEVSAVFPLLVGVIPSFGDVAKRDCLGGSSHQRSWRVFCKLAVVLTIDLKNQTVGLEFIGHRLSITEICRIWQNVIHYNCVERHQEFCIFLVVASEQAQRW